MKDFTVYLFKVITFVLLCVAVFCFTMAGVTLKKDIENSRLSPQERRSSGNLSNDEWRVLMISKGLAEYNATNGNWQWKDQSK